MIAEIYLDKIMDDTRPLASMRPRSDDRGNLPNRYAPRCGVHADRFNEAAIR